MRRSPTCAPRSSSPTMARPASHRLARTQSSDGTSRLRSIPTRMIRGLRASTPLFHDGSGGDPSVKGQRYIDSHLRQDAYFSGSNGLR